MTHEERDEVNALTQQAMSQLRSQLSQRETDEINQERVERRRLDAEANRARLHVKLKLRRRGRRGEG